MTAAEQRSSVFLLAQNRLLREALTKILNKKTDVQVVGASAFSPCVLEQISSSSPDLLLMDSFTSGASQTEFIREVQHSLPSIKVLMIGMEAEETAFLAAVREGAVGYVLKDASAMEVVTALRAVISGEAVCPPELSL